MCGIMGFVGKPKNKIRTYELATNLLRETQQRGRDATGFYSIDQNGLIDWYKNDVPAGQFVRSARAWKHRCPSAITLIGHARMSTHGTERKEINNHPHVSDDQHLAIVHNGIISTFMTIANRCNLNLQSQCDSEVILRLIESKPDIVSGIKKLFQESRTSYGNFACLATHMEENGEIYYYVFRNRTNPITFLDLRKELGQYFFCSTPDIWNLAARKSGMKKTIRKKACIDVPPYEIWKINAETLHIQKIPVKHEELPWFSEYGSTSNYSTPYNSATAANSVYKSISQITQETSEEVKSLMEEITTSLVGFQSTIDEFDNVSMELDKENIIVILEEFRDQINNMRDNPPVLDCNYKLKRLEYDSTAESYPGCEEDFCQIYP